MDRPRIKKALAVVGMLTVLVLSIPLFAVGCDPVKLLIGPPDTYPDMWRQVEALPVPDDFQLVSKTAGGRRSGFAGASPPVATLSYSAPWTGGTLCDRVLALASAQGVPSPIRATDCAWTVEIPSGWSARAVNVW